MANDHPVILCHGLFGWGPREVVGFPYWGTARAVRSPLRRREVSVGPLSSTHDRACEMAFQIKGGRVDYGAQHSETAGHDRFGRTHVALHPDWSEREPVHVVGHSMGGPTVWMLQHLLATDFFGWGSNANWIKSVTSISGVLNGSTATYFFGCDEETGLVAEESIGGFLTRTIELHIRITGDLFDRFYDFDLDHWRLDTSPGDPLLLQLECVARSPMFRDKDNAAYCLTIQGLLEQNVSCRTYPDTHYFSYVTEQTTGGALTAHHYPEPLMNPLLIPSALYIGHHRFDGSFYAGFESSDWWHNDGLVSVYSQMFPRLAGDHPVGGDSKRRVHFEPGAWYHEMVESTDHIDIVALPELAKVGLQRKFYTRLFERLASL